MRFFMICIPLISLHWKSLISDFSALERFDLWFRCIGKVWFVISVHWKGLISDFSALEMFDFWLQCIGKVWFLISVHWKSSVWQFRWSIQCVPQSRPLLSAGWLPFPQRCGKESVWVATVYNQLQSHGKYIDVACTYGI